MAPYSTRENDPSKVSRDHGADGSLWTEIAADVLISFTVHLSEELGEIYCIIFQAENELSSFHTDLQLIRCHTRWIIWEGGWVLLLAQEMLICYIHYNRNKQAERDESWLAAVKEGIEGQSDKVLNEKIYNLQAK